MENKGYNPGIKHLLEMYEALQTSEKRPGILTYEPGKEDCFDNSIMQNLLEIQVSSKL